MDGLTLLEQAEAAGLTVRADGDKLVVRGPKRLEPLAKALLANKPAVMAVLATTATAWITTRRGYLAPADLPERWREFYDERAAIREYGGGQPREHAEVEAWKETLAAMRVADKKNA